MLTSLLGQSYFRGFDAGALRLGDIVLPTVKVHCHSVGIKAAGCDSAAPFARYHTEMQDCGDSAGERAVRLPCPEVQLTSDLLTSDSFTSDLPVTYQQHASSPAFRWVCITMQASTIPTTSSISLISGIGE